MSLLGYVGVLVWFDLMVSWFFFIFFLFLIWFWFKGLVGGFWDMWGWQCVVMVVW